MEFVVEEVPSRALVFVLVFVVVTALLTGYSLCRYSACLGRMTGGEFTILVSLSNGNGEEVAA